MEILKEIPKHLKPYIVPQKYDQYTPIDHACWRYIMKLSKDFFADNAHPVYLEGLNKTGITTERIPKISEMDDKLKQFGWRAASITGFIPPAVFSEMLSLKIMPIACDMRKLENISYTPAPDIVHEAAGHAPIIADPGYAKYLEKLGQVARRVIFAKEDCDVYEAILDLSEIKEMPDSSKQEVEKAEENLEKAYKSVSYDSEATEFSRIGWWSIEYGLVKDQETGKFLIYGAGLLSSVGESFECVKDHVKKIPFTLDCIGQDYDITKPQPQLFYSNSFEEMVEVLNEYEKTTAYYRGGKESLDKAIKARTVCTSVLSSGLEVGGQLVKYRTDKEGNISYLHYTGPTQLAYQETQLENQGPSYHKEGFGTALGLLKGLAKDPSQLSQSDLESLGFKDDAEGCLEFESGVIVRGSLKEVVSKGGKNLILAFENCKVTLEDEVLFEPSWGTFDMACGNSEIKSVFGGAADRGAYLDEVGPDHSFIRDQKVNTVKNSEKLFPLYQSLREIRESNAVKKEQLDQLYASIEDSFPKEWLLKMELLELYYQVSPEDDKVSLLRSSLEELKKESEVLTKLIDRGMQLFKN